MAFNCTYILLSTPMWCYIYFFAKVCICLIQYWHMYINVQSLSYILLMKMMWYKIPPLYEIIVNTTVFEQDVFLLIPLCMCEWIVTLTFIETGSRVACWIYVYVTLYMYIIMCEKLSILTFFKNVVHEINILAVSY